MPAVRNSALTSSRIRNLALPILLLALGLLALLARPALARDSEWTVECISDRHGSNSNSYLSGGRALYSHTSIQSDVAWSTLHCSTTSQPGRRYRSRTPRRTT